MDKIELNGLFVATPDILEYNFTVVAEAQER